MIGLPILLLVGLTAAGLLLVLRAPPIAYAGLASAVVSVLVAIIIGLAVSLAVEWPPSWLPLLLWALAAEPVRAYFAFRARDELTPRSWFTFAFGNALFYVPSFAFGFFAQLWGGDLLADLGSIVAVLLLQMALSVLTCRLVSMRWPWPLAAGVGIAVSITLNLLIVYWPSILGVGAVQAWLLALVMGVALLGVGLPMTNPTRRANEGP